MSRHADPATVPGLPESRLAATDLARLPENGPEAPWHCRARSLTWVQRGHAPGFEWEGEPTSLVMVTFVDYLETPVGPYHEVVAAALLKPRRGAGALPVVQVPFIAVDSLTSVHGGRANWALPKTTARFDVDLDRVRAEARGEGWSISARAKRQHRRGRPVIPAAMRFRVTGPLGPATSTLRGLGRPVPVRTEVRGETLPGWLGSGRHLAFVLEGTMTVGAPE